MTDKPESASPYGPPGDQARPSSEPEGTASTQSPPEQSDQSQPAPQSTPPDPASAQPAPGSDRDTAQPTPPYPTAPPTYVPTGVPSTPSPAPSPVGMELRKVASAPGITTVLGMAAITLALGVVSALLYLPALSWLGETTGDQSLAADPGSVLLIVAILTGFSLGAALTVDVDGGLITGGTTSGSFVLLSLGTLLAVGVGIFLWVRRRAPRDQVTITTPAASLARSGVEAVTAGALVAALTGFWSLAIDESWISVRVSSQGFTTFLAVGIVAFGASLLARQWPVIQRRSDLPLVAVREAVEIHRALFIVFGAIALVAVAVAAIQGDVPSAMFAALPLLVNLAAYAASLGFMGGIRVDVSGSESTDYSLWTLSPGYTVALVIGAIVVVVVSAIRVGVRRPRLASPRWSRAWPAVVVSAVIWLLLVGLLLPTYANWSADAIGIGQIFALYPLGWTLIGVLVAIAIVSLVAEVLPGFLYRLSPAALSLIGGSAATARWLAAPIAASPTTSAGAPPSSTQESAYQQSPTYQQSQPPPPPMRSSTKRGIVIVGVLALVLIVAGAALAGVVSYLNSQRSADAVVEEYLTLIAEGQAEEASAMVDPGVTDAEQSLLTDEVLQGADARIEVISTSVDYSDDEYASVTATLSLDGERFTHTFTVEAGPNEYGLLRTWELTDPMLVPVTITTDYFSSVSVGGTSVDLTSAGYGYYSATYYVYPGVYTVSAPTDSAYLSAEPQVVSARSATDYSQTGVYLTASPTEEFQASVLEQVQEFVTDCASVPTNADYSCPYQVQDTTLSSLSVTLQPDGFEDFGLYYFQSSQAIITIESNPTASDPDPEPEEVEFSVWGSIEIDEDGAPTVTTMYAW